MLDSALAHCVAMPMPTWHTKGVRGWEPCRTEHNFAVHSLREGARIDMLRGEISDDLGNGDWNHLLRQLPKFRAWVLKTWGSNLNQESRGNAMEMACGLAYATAHGGRNLPVGQSLTFASEASREAWAACWPFWAGLGLTPAAETAATSRSSSSRPQQQHAIGVPSQRPPIAAAAAAAAASSATTSQQRPPAGPQAKRPRLPVRAPTDAAGQIISARNFKQIFAAASGASSGCPFQTASGPAADKIMSRVPSLAPAAKAARAAQPLPQPPGPLPAQGLTPGPPPAEPPPQPPGPPPAQGLTPGPPPAEPLAQTPGPPPAEGPPAQGPPPALAPAAPGAQTPGPELEPGAAPLPAASAWAAAIAATARGAQIPELERPKPAPPKLERPPPPPQEPPPPPQEPPALKGAAGAPEPRPSPGPPGSLITRFLLPPPPGSPELELAPTPAQGPSPALAPAAGGAPTPGPVTDAAAAKAAARQAAPGAPAIGGDRAGTVANRAAAAAKAAAPTPGPPATKDELQPFRPGFTKVKEAITKGTYTLHHKI